MRAHAAGSWASSRAGLWIPSGHGVAGGQLRENQPMISSNFLAVNVFAGSSSRSKKRQSPAARRPTVAALHCFAAT